MRSLFTFLLFQFSLQSLCHKGGPVIIQLGSLLHSFYHGEQVVQCVPVTGQANGTLSSWQCAEMMGRKLCVTGTTDLLQCAVRDGAGAEVTDVVQTDEHSWATWTGDGRQVAGGFALGALPLVILEVIVICLLALQHPLKMWV